MFVMLATAMKHIFPCPRRGDNITSERAAGIKLAPSVLEWEVLTSKSLENSVMGDFGFERVEIFVTRVADSD